MAWALVLLSACTFVLGLVSVICGIVPEPAAVLAAVSVIAAAIGIRHIERRHPRSEEA